MFSCTSQKQLEEKPNPREVFALSWNDDFFQESLPTLLMTVQHIDIREYSLTVFLENTFSLVDEPLHVFFATEDLINSWNYSGYQSQKEKYSFSDIAQSYCQFYLGKESPFTTNLIALWRYFLKDEPAFRTALMENIFFNRLFQRTKNLQLFTINDLATALANLYLSFNNSLTGLYPSVWLNKRNYKASTLFSLSDIFSSDLKNHYSKSDLLFSCLLQQNNFYAEELCTVEPQTEISEKLVQHYHLSILYNSLSSVPNDNWFDRTLDEIKDAIHSILKTELKERKEPMHAAWLREIWVELLQDLDRLEYLWEKNAISGHKNSLNSENPKNAFFDEENYNNYFGSYFSMGHSKDYKSNNSFKIKRYPKTKIILSELKHSVILNYLPYILYAYIINLRSASDKDLIQIIDQIMVGDFNMDNQLRNEKNALGSFFTLKSRKASSYSSREIKEQTILFKRCMNVCYHYKGNHKLDISSQINYIESTFLFLYSFFKNTLEDDPDASLVTKLKKNMDPEETEALLFQGPLSKFIREPAFDQDVSLSAKSPQLILYMIALLYEKEWTTVPSS